MTEHKTGYEPTGEAPDADPGIAKPLPDVARKQFHEPIIVEEEKRDGKDSNTDSN